MTTDPEQLNILHKISNTLEDIKSVNDKVLSAAENQNHNINKLPKSMPVMDELKIKGVSMIKGDPGIPGKDALPPSKEELISIIKPLIPQPIKGDKGDSIQGPPGPPGKPGVGQPGPPGKDAKPLTKTELKALIKPLIPEPIQGEPGKDGSPDTPFEIKTKLESLDGEYRLDASAIKNLPIGGASYNERRNPSGVTGPNTATDNAVALFNGATGKIIKNSTLVYSNNRLGVNVASPTASLHLPAGTAAANTAPLKFNSGTNLTTPEAGAVEFDGTLLTFTPSTTRYSFIFDNLGKAGGQTIVGGTAATNTLTLQPTSSGAVAVGADIIFKTGNNGATEVVRITSSAGITATGGTITYSGGYTYHTFTSNGTFTPNNSGTVDFVCLGGGGAGGGASANSYSPGGGGGGGWVKGVGTNVTAQAYTVVVGAGGVGVFGATGGNGGNSTVFGFTGTGGGGGAGSSTGVAVNGSNGGCGGGGHFGGNGGIGSQGFDGGKGYGISGSLGGGGGGGLTVIGSDGTSTIGGDGGAGDSWLDGVVRGGGGGGAVRISGTPGSGGNGGGGAGVLNGNGVAGVDGKGGGGGGGGGAQASTGGNGGSGIVIIRYLTVIPPAVGIGISPTAILHLKAGTSSSNSAPLKFTSGTLLTTAETGAVEFLTDAFYGTITTGAARRTFAFLESPTFTGTVTAPTIISTNVVRLKGYTVATLPAGTQGNTAFVTDATAPTYLGALTGGGAVVTPVFYNGTAWVSI